VFLRWPVGLTADPFGKTNGLSRLLSPRSNVPTTYAGWNASEDFQRSFKFAQMLAATKKMITPASCAGVRWNNQE